MNQTDTIKVKALAIGAAVAACWIAGSVHAAAPAKSSVSAPVVRPVHSQLLAYNSPEGFGPIAEYIKDKVYAQEWVPDGEDKTTWTQFVTITGARDYALQIGITPQLLADRVANGFKSACPATFNSINLGGVSVSGGPDAVVTVAACGLSPTTDNKTSETAMIVVLKGRRDYYTLQWAEKGEKSETPPPIDENKWRAKLKQLMPLKLCPLLPGEAAPFPSCLSQK